MKQATEMKIAYRIVKRMERDLLQLKDLHCIGHKEEEYYYSVLTWITDKIEFYNKFITL